jgi:hypothetical protein
MSLDDIAVSRRSFLHAGLATAGALLLPEDVLAQDNKQLAKADEMPVLKKSRISYDQLIAQLKKDPKGDAAGSYEALKVKYLDQVLVDEFKMVIDSKNPKRNPQGFMKQWLYMGDAKQRAKAIENIKEDLRAEGKMLQKDWDAHIKIMIANLPTERMGAMYRGPFGQKSKSGYLIIGPSIFTLTNEQDLFSTLDLFNTYAQGYEAGIKVGEKELNSKNDLLSFFKVPILNLHARSTQVSNILQGQRKVSADYGAIARSEYLADYGRFMTGTLDQVKRSSAPNAIEVVPILESFLSDINSRMQKLGYEHKLVDAEKNTWDLVKIR